MPRRNLIRTSENPYHVTIRCNNKEWFELPLREVWFYSIEAIKVAKAKHPVKIQAFVLMNNHYHLLIWTPNADLDKFMFYFNSKFSHFLRKRTQRINRIFGDRYKWSIIKDERYYCTVLRYIYQNPLRASLVKHCQEYPFSTLNTKNRHLVDIRSEQEKHTNFLQWVNQTKNKINQKDIKNGLKMSEFKVELDENFF